MARARTCTKRCACSLPALVDSHVGPSKATLADPVVCGAHMHFSRAHCRLTLACESRRLSAPALLPLHERSGADSQLRRRSESSRARGLVHMLTNRRDVTGLRTEKTWLAQR
eukprot:4580171-Pleurochrysis_carterae.AAC.3